MKCPIFYTGWLEHETEDAKKHTDCLKEGCAWWDTTLKTCAISRIANRLDQITYFMAKREEREGG